MQQVLLQLTTELHLACLAELRNLTLLTSLRADAATEVSTVLPCALLLTPGLLQASLFVVRHKLT